MKVTKVLKFCAGHRLMNHEGKCRHLHGHNYRADITCDTNMGLDHVGRVVDFSVIKEKVGKWLDYHWDHGMVLNALDTVAIQATNACPGKRYLMDGNPTAENMAALLLVESQCLLQNDGVRVVGVRLWETDTCYADAIPCQ